MTNVSHDSDSDIKLNLTLSQAFMVTEALKVRLNVVNRMSTKVEKQSYKRRIDDIFSQIERQL